MLSKYLLLNIYLSQSRFFSNPSLFSKLNMFSLNEVYLVLSVFNDFIVLFHVFSIPFFCSFLESSRIDFENQNDNLPFNIFA